MKRGSALVLLSLTIGIAIGQKRPIQVSYTPDYNNSCGEVILGSGFEKSGMVRYVARSKILESKWNGRQLTIKIFVVSECCPPDYLGYVERSDTLILYYGDKKGLPTKDGMPDEVEICLCGHNGCCYEFEYVINGLSRSTNYLVAVSNVSAFGLKPYPIGYIDSKYKSVHYSRQCLSLESCLDEKIDEAVLYYKKLSPMYDSLIDHHNNQSQKEKDMVDQIERVWIKYFSFREAIYDEFLTSNLDGDLYNRKLNEFELQIQRELKLLEPKLNITSKYLHGGSFIEPIK
jgi:hypothetical protein